MVDVAVGSTQVRLSHGMERPHKRGRARNTGIVDQNQDDANMTGIDAVPGAAPRRLWLAALPR
jgi:hypothetical protein